MMAIPKSKDIMTIKIECTYKELQDYLNTAKKENHIVFVTSDNVKTLITGKAVKVDLNKLAI